MKLGFSLFTNRSLFLLFIITYSSVEARKAGGGRSSRGSKSGSGGSRSPFMRTISETISHVRGGTYFPSTSSRAPKFSKLIKRARVARLTGKTKRNYYFIPHGQELDRTLISGTCSFTTGSEVLEVSSPVQEKFVTLYFVCDGYDYCCGENCCFSETVEREEVNIGAIFGVIFAVIFGILFFVFIFYKCWTTGKEAKEAEKDPDLYYLLPSADPNTVPKEVTLVPVSAPVVKSLPAERSFLKQSRESLTKSAPPGAKDDKLSAPIADPMISSYANAVSEGNILEDEPFAAASSDIKYAALNKYKDNKTPKEDSTSPKRHIDDANMKIGATVADTNLRLSQVAPKIVDYTSSSSSDSDDELGSPRARTSYAQAVTSSNDVLGPPSMATSMQTSYFSAMSDSMLSDVSAYKDAETDSLRGSYKFAVDGDNWLPDIIPEDRRLEIDPEKTPIATRKHPSSERKSDPMRESYFLAVSDENAIDYFDEDTTTDHDTSLDTVV